MLLQEEERASEKGRRPEAECFDEEDEEGECSDSDDFIVDDWQPIADRRKKRKPIFPDAYVIFFIP
jgi:hypothetical protein